MKSKLLEQDGNYDEWCEEELIKVYKDAAEFDNHLFGDYDYSYVWLEKKTDSDV